MMSIWYMRWYGLIGLLVIMPYVDGMQTITRVQNALFNENIATFKQVLRDNPDGINGVGKEGFTALGCAVSKGDLACMRALLAAHADPNGKDHNGNTPIMLAAVDGREVLIGCLAEAKADVNAWDNRGYAPLHLAMISFQDTVIPSLLKHRADPKKTTSEGTTTLKVYAIASCYRMSKIVGLLRSSGAHVEPER